ncbi:hypothetical protein GCM10008171_32340 [Methylopila jiangsuensis]|uniref:Localization factor PodJL n=1 Tax=Methylopila jiangsuensis TaxID=586230 RepID=A0A9W6N530_9HYPH|nr:tetratricopeptide repeat protein [Methylopila jiangsuensis]MDR6284631.1 localization factor PodJL [Methylopila jiangsuensis]GLK77980.1 hypothetical protein GCM10008171_32340 [Methylopila jiangsuensis]
MSFSDQARAARAIAPQGEGRDAEARPIDRLAERLADTASPAPQSPPRRSLEQLVSMLSRRNLQTEDRLTNALEGFARWTDTPPPAPSASPEEHVAEPIAPVAERAPVPAAEEEPAAASSRATMTLRAALAEIAARQKALDDEAPRPSRAPMAAAAPATDPAVIAELRRRIDDLAGAVQDLPTRADVDGLLREIAAVAERCDAERPARLDPVSLKAIETLVLEVERMRGDAASPQMLASFSAELAALSERLEAAAPPNVEAMAAIASQIDDIRGELDHFPRIAAVDRLAGDIQTLVRRLDEQEAAASRRGDELQRLETTLRAEMDARSPAVAFDGFSARLDALTESLARRDAADDAVLPARMDALADRIDALAAASSRASDVESVAEAVRAGLAQPGGVHDLGRRIEALTEELSSRAAVAPRLDAVANKIDGLSERVDVVAASARARSESFERIEDAVRGIAEHLVAGASAPAMGGAPLAGLETRIAGLVDTLDRTGGRIDDLNAGFAALAARVETSCANAGAEAARAAASALRDHAAAPLAAAPGVDPTELAEVLAGIRDIAVRSDRRTSDTLEAVRLTLDRLLERMEGFEANALRAAPRTETAPAPAIDATEAARAAARRALAELSPEDAAAFSRPQAQTKPVAPVRDIPVELSLDTLIEPDAPAERGAPAPAATTAPILDDEPAAPSSKAASLIAAARRATSRPPAADEIRPAPELLTEPAESRFGAVLATLKARRRPLAIALAAALIVIGVVKLAGSLSDTHSENVVAAPAIEEPAATAPEAAPAARAPENAAPEAPAAEEPALPAPAAPAEPPAAAPRPQSQSSFTPPRKPAPDITDYAFAESLGAKPQKFAAPKADDDLTTGSLSRDPEALPDTIGGSMLRLRAVQGDPSAQLEIADRLAEGRGVAPNPAAAAHWLEKAAAQGLAPAQHRLGSLYEKGRGVARDLVVARRWYEQAAASGNVRAMHNLGVLHAEGGLGKPDFAAASVWFRMAAERGLVDSQYNLAVLQARGLAGKRDLAEAYKWFALAAAQGDQDAGRKREEVAKALGKSLASAQQTVANFKPRMLDSAANEAPTPPGGWDQAGAPADAREPVSLR